MTCQLLDCVLERKAELSDSELSQLIRSFAGMGRWFFDNRLIDQLTAVLVDQAKADRAQSHCVLEVAECLASINHKNLVLQQYLDGLGGKL